MCSGLVRPARKKEMKSTDFSSPSLTKSSLVVDVGKLNHKFELAL